VDDPAVPGAGSHQGVPAEVIAIAVALALVQPPGPAPGPASGPAAAAIPPPAAPSAWRLSAWHSAEPARGWRWS